MRKPHKHRLRISRFSPRSNSRTTLRLSHSGVPDAPRGLTTPAHRPRVFARYSDHDNLVVHVADSKTTTGIGDMPITDAARDAFRRQIEETQVESLPVPQPKENSRQPVDDQPPESLESDIEARSGLALHPLYELRHTFATRLSAGGVADHMVTQMQRQTDADVFKLYSQAKLGMMREALAKLDRDANERSSNFGTDTLD